MKKLLSCLLILVPLFIIAQPYTPEQALEKFAKYPNERVFIQTDKDAYLAGETIYFKGYVFVKHQLSRVSTNLQVELLDANKKVVTTMMVPLGAGITEGSINLDKKLDENVYYLRGYTSWMLNFDERYQFMLPVNIYNPSSAKRLVEKPGEWQATVHPESGVLMDNMETKLAVRLHGNAPATWSGYLFENNDPNNKLSDVNVLNKEIGTIIFAPRYGKKYSIKITDDKNKSSVIELADVVQNGTVLKAVNTRNGIAFNITSKGMQDPLKDYKIIAQQDGALVYSATIKNSRPEVNGLIPIDSATNGLLHITLFDAKGNPVAERLCFVNPANGAFRSPNIRFNRKSAAPRSLIDAAIDVDTISAYTYIVEVIDPSSQLNVQHATMPAVFWLGELAPLSPYSGEYFNNDGTTSDALDYFLMTEKWNRFSWPQLLQRPLPKLAYFPDNYLTYEGTVYRRKKPVTEQMVNLVFQTKDSAKIYVPVKTDSAGRFKAANLFFRDTVKVFYKLNSLKDAATKIDVSFARQDNVLPYKGALPTTNFYQVERKPADTLPMQVKHFIEAQKNFENIEAGFKRLLDVVVTTKSKKQSEELNKKMSSPMFNEPSQLVFDLLNGGTDGAGTIVDYLIGKVPGLYEENGMPVMRGQPMVIYIDEWQADMDRLMGTPLSDVAMLKVLRSPFLLGTSSPVLAIYTKRGSNQQVDPLSLVKSNELLGYPTTEKFKSISYNEDAFTKGTDTRSVLYWNTTLVPENGPVDVHFYNNDISKSIRITIIGFTAKGVPVYMDKVVAF